MSDMTLQHHGILGMKWGVRRTPAQLSKGGSKKSSSFQAQKNVKSMSDAELRQTINRIQMEKQYAQLTQREQSAGAKFVQSVLTSAAKDTASKYVSRYMTAGVDAVIKKWSK